MTSSVEPLRVACLGAGYFAQFHYDAWRRAERVTLVGACDADRDKAAATGLPAFGELDELLATAKPELLDIITPPGTHLAAITSAVDQGVKAIICQKPFCTSLAEARKATALAEAAGVTLVVHENFRFQPWYRTIRQALDNRAIGDVLQLTFRLSGPAALFPDHAEAAHPRDWRPLDRHVPFSAGRAAGCLCRSAPAQSGDCG
jgi:predicted dehydrogenase